MSRSAIRWKLNKRHWQQLARGLYMEGAEPPDEFESAFAVVVECIPADLAQKLSSALKIPTIGIGAGAGCDGQILVAHDMLGLFEDFQPRFVKQYADLGREVMQAVEKYCREVRDATFPAAEHGFR